MCPIFTKMHNIHHILVNRETQYDNIIYLISILILHLYEMCKINTWLRTFISPTRAFSFFIYCCFCFLLCLWEIPILQNIIWQVWKLECGTWGKGVIEKAFSKTKLKVRIERCDILACVGGSVQLCQTEILSSLFSLLNDNCWTPNINQHYWKLPKMKLNFIFLSSLCFVEFVVC